MPTPWLSQESQPGIGVKFITDLLVVSTLSMHHWADPTSGLAEIARVLRPGARVLIWDFRPGVRPYPFRPRHAHIPDPVRHA
jgi:SAM-dependent methyltransferase